MVTKKENSKSKTKLTENNNPEKEKVEKILVENFVSLQKVMTNLAIKFDGLSNQISKLLELFEISAKTLAEKGLLQDENKDNKKVVEKLDNLLEQNKIIAKGIALLHEDESSQEPRIQQRPNYFPSQMRRINGGAQLNPNQMTNNQRDPRFNETTR